MGYEIWQALDRDSFNVLAIGALLETIAAKCTTCVAQGVILVGDSCDASELRDLTWENYDRELDFLRLRNGCPFDLGLIECTRDHSFILTKEVRIEGPFYLEIPGYAVVGHKELG